MQISVNEEAKKEKNLLKWWTQHADLVHVRVDADGGRGHVGARTHCMCVRMDCLWTQTSVKKKQRK